MASLLRQFGLIWLQSTFLPVFFLCFCPISPVFCLVLPHVCLKMPVFARFRPVLPVSPGSFGFVQICQDLFGFVRHLFAWFRPSLLQWQGHSACSWLKAKYHMVFFMSLYGRNFFLSSIYFQGHMALFWLQSQGHNSSWLKAKGRFSLFVSH